MYHNADYGNMREQGWKNLEVEVANKTFQMVKTQAIQLGLYKF
jgi:hypothetical protein